MLIYDKGNVYKSFVGIILKNKYYMFFYHLNF